MNSASVRDGSEKMKRSTVPLMPADRCDLVWREISEAWMTNRVHATVAWLTCETAGCSFDYSSAPFRHTSRSTSQIRRALHLSHRNGFGADLRRPKGKIHMELS
jgi:hypothetical protein